MVAPCPFPTHQGTQVFIRHLANTLAAAGHSLRLFTYALAEPLSGAELDARVVWSRVGGDSVGTRSGPSVARLRADAELVARVWATLRSVQPDVLHVHNAEGLAAGALLKRTLGIPLVFHAHNVMAHELPVYAGASRWKRGAALQAGRLFDRSVPRYADAVICFDDRQAELYARAGVPARRLHVIPLALDHDELAVHTVAASATRRTRTAKHPPRVVYAGNPDAYQNPALLRATFQALRRRRPDALLRIISNHPASAFGGLAHDAGVELKSMSGPRELAALIAEADVGLCTRTLWSGAPVKVLSYISAGIPVVACSKGAALLADYPDAGALAEDDPEALASALLRVVEAPASFDVSRMREATHIGLQAHAYRDVYAAAIAECSVRAR